MSYEPNTLVAIGGPMHGKRIPDHGLRCVVSRLKNIDPIALGEDEVVSRDLESDVYRRMKLGGEGWDADVYMWDMKASVPL